MLERWSRNQVPDVVPHAHAMRVVQRGHMIQFWRQSRTCVNKVTWCSLNWEHYLIYLCIFNINIIIHAGKALQRGWESHPFLVRGGRMPNAVQRVIRGAGVQVPNVPHACVSSNQQWHMIQFCMLIFNKITWFSSDARRWFNKVTWCSSTNCEDIYYMIYIYI